MNRPEPIAYMLLWRDLVLAFVSGNLDGETAERFGRYSRRFTTERKPSSGPPMLIALTSNLGQKRTLCLRNITGFRGSHFNSKGFLEPDAVLDPVAI